MLNGEPTISAVDGEVMHDHLATSDTLPDGKHSRDMWERLRDDPYRLAFGGTLVKSSCTGATFTKHIIDEPNDTF